MTRATRRARSATAHDGGYRGSRGDRVTWNFGLRRRAPARRAVVNFFPREPRPNGGDIEQAHERHRVAGRAVGLEDAHPDGARTFVCRVHALFTGGAWSGMACTAAVSPATWTNPSVDFTETASTAGAGRRKTNDGGANPFATSLTVLGRGSDMVRAPSADEKGNAETTKLVAFSVDLPIRASRSSRRSPSSGAAPLLVRFTAAGFDPDGGSLAYKSWSSRKVSCSVPTATRTFTKTGTYTRPR